MRFLRENSGILEFLALGALFFGMKLSDKENLSFTDMPTLGVTALGIIVFRYYNRRKHFSNIHHLPSEDALNAIIHIPLKIEKIEKIQFRLFWNCMLVMGACALVLLPRPDIVLIVTLVVIIAFEKYLHWRLIRVNEAGRALQISPSGIVYWDLILRQRHFLWNQVNGFELKLYGLTPFAERLGLGNISFFWKPAKSGSFMIFTIFP